MKSIRITIVVFFALLMSWESFGQTELENKVIASLLDKGVKFIPQYKLSKRKGRVKSFNRLKQPAYVLLNVTTNPVMDASFDTTGMYEKEVLTDADRSMLRDFCLKNRAPLSLNYGYGKQTDIVYMRQADYKKFFTKNDWHTYYKTYDQKPLVMVSRPGFNSSKTKALIYLTYSLGDSDGAGYYLVMKKSWDRWKPDGNMLVWVK